MNWQKTLIASAVLSMALTGMSGCQGSAVPSESESASVNADGLVLPRSNDHLKSPTVLVFSGTLDWRHTEGIPGANLFLVKMTEALGFGIYTTENPAIFTKDRLAKFDVVVFNNFTGDALTPAQETAFEDWFKAGGGWIGIHGAGDSSHKDWSWYSETLLGSTFTAHPADPQFQTARVQSLNEGHPVLEGLPESWEHNEEWYSFDAPAQDFGQVVILGVDESTYSPKNLVYGDHKDLRMDLTGAGPIAHPVVWARCVEQGRGVYSALGHRASAYDSEYNQMMLKNALTWVLKKTDPESKGCNP